MYCIIINDKLHLLVSYCNAFLLAFLHLSASVSKLYIYMVWLAQFDPKQLFLCSCQCGQCQSLDTEEECLCCQEIDPVVSTIQESAAEVQCITQHEGFQPVVLDINVPQTAYFNYRQQYGPLNLADNEWVVCIYPNVMRLWEIFKAHHKYTKLF